MRTSFNRSFIHGLAVLILSICLGNTYATPNDDLASAVRKSDLDEMRKALEQGADPNMLVCVHYFLGYFYPSDHEECVKAQFPIFQPIIWGIEAYGGRMTQEVVLAMEKLLAKAGAKADTYSINQKSGETKKGGNAIAEVFSRSWGNRPQLQPERAMVLAKAGAIPSEQEIRWLVGRGDAEATIFVNALKVMDSVEDPIFLSRCNFIFDKHTTIDGYQNYIDKYQGNDSCNLIPQAKVNLAVLIAQEKRRKIQEEMDLTERAKAEAVAEMERVRTEVARQAKEAERQAKELKLITAFRKSIADGDETNCGPVIVVKGKLVKVASAVANYGNEHWIRRDQIFPAGYGCRFVNGQYQMPEE